MKIFCNQFVNKVINRYLISQTYCEHFANTLLDGDCNKVKIFVIIRRINPWTGNTARSRFSVRISSSKPSDRKALPGPSIIFLNCPQLRVSIFATTIDWILPCFGKVGIFNHLQRAGGVEDGASSMIGLADLSVWCHVCQAYLQTQTNPYLTTILQKLQQIKFGVGSK